MRRTFCLMLVATCLGCSGKADEEARKVLMDRLEGNIRVELRLLKFKTGRRKSAWVKNCVAIGLSGGFVEPLESTSIHLIQAGITRLLRLFPISGCSEVLQKQYNQESRTEYERIRDFIVLHYKATERDDTPFWKQCRDMPIPDELDENMRLFRNSGRFYRNAEEMFALTSWVQVMVGQHVLPQGYHPLVDQLSPDKLREFMASVQGVIANCVDAMPMHQAFIDRYCKAA